MKRFAMAFAFLMQLPLIGHGATVQLTALDVIYTFDSWYASIASVIPGTNTLVLTPQAGSIYTDSGNKESFVGTTPQEAADWGNNAIPFSFQVTARNSSATLASFSAQVAASFDYSGDIDDGFGYARNDLSVETAGGKFVAFAETRLNPLDGEIAESGQSATFAAGTQSAQATALIAIASEVRRRPSKAGGYGVITGYVQHFGMTTTVVSAVPEPELWAMLCAGLLLVGTAARRRVAC